ncbi:MAG TPA: DUF1835 domain-containing protein [Flavisolibacter sp.]|jgi:hypothetical protein|nr:DUF1835 domain-containing protein [Flavisolibacter sp.]
MIHIVFQEADIEVLNKAIELDAELQGKVEIIRDDYAVGPLNALYETDGYQQRREWWKGQLAASPYNEEQLMNMVDDRLMVHQLRRALDEDSKEVLWIWMGQNAHDVCGYYWLVGQLADYVGRVFVLYMNNLPFINEKGQIFYPTTLHQILPKEFLKAKKLCRRVTPSEFEVDGDEWKKLMADDAMVRVLEGGKKLSGRGEDFYDADILTGLTAEPQKGHRAIHNILAKMKIKTGDVFLLWRMKKLAEMGKVELTGDPSKGWKEFEVKLKTAAAETVESDNQN